VAGVLGWKEAGRGFGGVGAGAAEEDDGMG